MTVIDKEPAIRREPPGFSDTRILIKVTDRALYLDVVPVSHGYVVSVYLVSKYIDVGISVLRIQVDQLPVIVQLHSFCLKEVRIFADHMRQLACIASEKINIINVEHLVLHCILLFVSSFGDESTLVEVVHIRHIQGTEPNAQNRTDGQAFHGFLQSGLQIRITAHFINKPLRRMPEVHRLQQCCNQPENRIVCHPSVQPVHHVLMKDGSVSMSQIRLDHLGAGVDPLLFAIASDPDLSFSQP